MTPHAVPRRAAGPALDVAADSSGGWLTGRPTTRWDALAAVVIGIVTLLAVWLLRTPVNSSDPWNYVDAAIHFPADTWVPLGYTRFGMIIPLLPVVAIFGNSEASHYFWPFVGSAVLAASLYLIGRRFWSPAAGVLAIVLALANPLVLPNLSRGYPDVQSTGVFCLAVVLAFHARDRRQVRGTAPAVVLVIVGFLLGWAFEARETSILTWPVIAAVLWARGRELRRAVVLVVAGLAVWAVADVAIGYFAYGDPLIRVHAFANQDLAAGQAPADQAARNRLIGRDRWFYLTAVLGYLKTAAGGTWHLFVLAVGVVGLAFRRSRFAAAWFLLAYLGFAAITGGISPDHPSGRIDIARYWIPFVVIAGLAAAGTTYAVSAAAFPRLARIRFGGLRLTARGVGLGLAILVAAGPVISTTAVVARSTAYAVNGATQLSALRDYMAENADGPVTVWTDFSSQRVIPVYQWTPFGGQRLWSGSVRTFNRDSPFRSGDYVVLNSPTSDACAFCREALKYYRDRGGEIKSSWQEVWSTPSRNLIVYRVP